MVGRIYPRIPFLIREIRSIRGLLPSFVGCGELGVEQHRGTTTNQTNLTNQCLRCCDCRQPKPHCPNRGAQPGPVKVACVEPVAVGDVLPDMPLFLEPETHVLVPLEATYQTASAAFPDALKGLLEAAPSA